MKLKESKIVFNALADETRLRILNLLREGELCVCDLMRVLKEPQSKISRHLAYLRHSKLVKGRKEGLWMYYSISKQATKTNQSVLGALKHGRSEYNEFKNDIKTLRNSKNRLIGCCE